MSQRRGSSVDVCPVGSQTFTLFTPLRHKNHYFNETVLKDILDKNLKEFQHVGM